MDNKKDLDNELEILMQAASDEKIELEKDEDDLGDDNNENDDDNQDKSSDNNEDDKDNSDDEDDKDSDDLDKDSDKKKEEDGSNEDDSKEQHSESFESIVVKEGNREISLDSKEEVAKYIQGKNRNNTKQRASRIDEIVNQANLSDEDLALMADVKAGKPGALKKLALDSKIDLADAEEFEGDYKPEFKAKHKTEVDNVIDDISNNPELATKFSAIAKELPDEFLSAVTSDAGNLQSFAAHVESGLADEILAIAYKQTALGNGTLLENYIKTGEELSSKKESGSKEKKKDSKKEREISDKEKKLRDRASADTDENKGGKSSDLSVDDLWNMSKEDLAKVDLRELDA